MLHICRVYQPDIVYLYLSGEMLSRQRQDERYTKCLDKLGELQGRHIEYHLIERPDFDRVYEYDFYYKEFQELINKIIEEEIDDGDELFLNISSGTPAMKSGLAVLQTLTEFPCRMIQVTTPVKKMNEHNHQDFDLNMMWELNDDNNEDFENRCHEITCPTLSEIKKEEIIKRHVNSFDYRAALDVADTLPQNRTIGYYLLLEIAYYRLLLDMRTVDRIAGDLGSRIFPVRSSGDRKLFEYALQLRVKYLRKEYADFIRAITPIIVDLFEAALKSNCHIDIRDYTWIRRDTNRMTGRIQEIRLWDRNKLNGTALLNVLQNVYADFKYGPIYSATLAELIQHYSNDTSLIRLVRDVRSVEENIRNMVAHTIVSVDDNVIHQETGYYTSQIMDMIQKMFNYTGINVRTEMWESYERMNEMIINEI